MSPLRLSRRATLRGLGLAGISVALPPLERMLVGRGQRGAQAQAGAKRLFIFHWPQGVPPSAWFPAEDGAGWKPTPCLTPIEPYRNDINVISGVGYSQIYQSSGSHGHAVAVFTGQKVVAPEPEKSRGPSVQHVAAKAIGAGSRFSLVSTGVYSQGEGWWSWSGAGVKDPVETNPQTLFARLFSSVTIDPAAGAKAAARKKSVLDYVKTDATDLQRLLGAADRKRLDEHLTSIRELEKAVATVGVSTATCAPGKPATVATRYGDYSQIAEYTQAMIGLQVMAQRCDLTRVSFMTLGPSQCYFTFPHLGITTDYHNICHSGFNEQASVGPRLDDRKIAFEYYKKIGAYHMEQFAYLLKLLKANDGMGALLDQAAVVGLSDFGDGGIHEHKRIPIIVAGKNGAAGAGMQTGRNIKVTDRCVTDVWQAALEAVGALPAGTKFGDQSLPTQPLPGLWV